MPKKTFTVDDFSGGTNGYESPQNIAPNELAQSQGFAISPGEVTVLGDMKAAYTPSAANANTSIEPGYGLFAFSNDYTDAGALAPTNYLVLMDGVTFDVYSDELTDSGTDDDWVHEAINLGGGSASGSPFNGKVKPCFFIADGAMRVSPGYFKEEDSAANMGGSGAMASDESYGGVVTATLSGSSSNIAIGDTVVINDMEFVILAGTGATWYLGRNMTGEYPNATLNSADVYVRLDTRWRGIVNRRNFGSITQIGKFTEWYSTYSTPRPPITWSNNVDDAVAVAHPFTAIAVDGATDATVDGTNAPCLMVGYENVPTASNIDSTWDGASVKLYCTALYDESKQESKPHLLTSSAFTVASSKDLLIWIGMSYADDAASGAYLVNKRVTGARVYYEDVTGDPGMLFQLIEIDFEKGCKKAEAETFTSWQESTANEVASCPHPDGFAHANRDDSDENEVFLFSDPPKAITYEINTGYTMDHSIHARYKTAVVSNRRLFVGNVYQDGKANGDRMIGSPVNKFDILPSSNTIDVTVGDGDEIIKLEAFADRVLQFKKRSLYIINVGGGQGGEFLESQHKNMGIENPSQSCLTEYGVAWANSKGVFLYDGNQVTDLTRSKLKISDSTRPKALNITESNIPIIGYHPANKWLIVQPQSKITDANDVEAWILDFKSGSWAYTNTFTSTDDYKTNMVWTADDELIFAAGTNSSNTPDFFKYQDPTNASAATKLLLLTKEFDLEMPGVKKTLKSVHITYSANASSYIEGDIIYKDSSGESTVALEEEKGGSTYYTEALGFKSTSNAVRTVRLTPTSSVKKAYTFQLKLHNPDASYPVAANFKLYSVAFVYRLLGAK